MGRAECKGINPHRPKNCYAGNSLKCIGLELREVKFGAKSRVLGIWVKIGVQRVLPGMVRQCVKKDR